MLFRLGLARAGEVDAHIPRPLIVVSNREPYLHSQDGNGPIVSSAATGGVAVALDALMRERGGVWLAHGAGLADRLVVDEADMYKNLLTPSANPDLAIVGTDSDVDLWNLAALRDGLTAIGLAWDQPAPAVVHAQTLSPR